MLGAMAAALASMGQTYSADDRARGFRDNDAEKTVTFIFDNALWQAANVTSVDVRGSFNSWKQTEGYELAYDEAEAVWAVTLPYAKVRIPGNSGQPEYKYVVNGSAWQSGEHKDFIPEGYVFMTSDRNNIVVFNDDDLETIKTNSRVAGTIKPLSDFDLTTRAGQEEISNFRLVPGTTQLFRCYHPFKWSRQQYETEPTRISLVKQLSAEEGIQSDICLSGDESGKLTSYNVGGTSYQEEIAPYYQEIMDAGHVLQVGTANGHTPDYNYVYYKNRISPRFGQWVSEICGFIKEAPAPFSIHCRLGTDRTGVFCATLAALCGAGWDEIAEDYQKSNRMYINEFRDYHLLKYAFEQLIGVESLDQVEDVAQAVQDYFVNAGILTRDDIAAVRAKLTAVPAGAQDAVTAAEDCEAEYFNLQGVRLEAPVAGLIIRRQGSKVEKIVIK